MDRRGLTPLPAAPLVLWLLLLSSSVGVAAAGGGSGTWYVEEYEYSFVEVLILICLVSMALVFEAVSHRLLHQVESSYKYGDLHEIVDTAMGKTHLGHHSKVRHMQLHKELLVRSGGEFMTLGYLAFCIFFFRHFKGFKWLHERVPSSQSFHCPETEEDWLHMAEVVHIKLFVGMVFYFVLISRIVNGSVEKIRLWERMRLHHVGAPDYDAPTMRPSHALESDLTEYINWRSYFNAKMVRMQSRRPLVFKEIFTRLGIDKAAPDASQQFQAVLDSDFSFAAYLSLNIAEGVKDAIEVHTSTWSALLFLFGFFAFLHRFAHISLIAVVPVCIAIVVTILAAMQATVSRKRTKITRSSATVAEVAKPQEVACPSDPATLGIHERFQTELWFIRLLQVVLFLISYGFARTLLDFHDWEEYPETSLLYSACFALLFAALAYHLPTVVPIFLGIMAMPPCLDDDNFAIFYDVLVLGRAGWLEQHGQMASKEPTQMDAEVVVVAIEEDAHAGGSL